MEGEMMSSTTFPVPNAAYSN